MIGHPTPAEITQGTVFSCARAENYDGLPVFGITITARCDVAHQKADIFNYVPLVRFEDWLLRDGRRILAARSAAAALGRLKGALSDAGMSSSIIDMLDHDTIYDSLNLIGSKQSQATAKRFREAQLEYSQALEAGAWDFDKSKEFINKNQKLYNRLGEELLSNGLAEYHYIERTEPGEQCHGYVALLREIRFIPSSLAKALLSGLDKTGVEHVCLNDKHAQDRFVFIDSWDYAMPIGLLVSPYIELFMQRLTHLFSRIGVTDFPPQKLASIRGIVPFGVEGVK